MNAEIRVATVSADASSIRHMSWKGDGVTRLAGEPTRRWVENHASAFDMFHFDSWNEESTLEETDHLLVSLKDAGKNLVYTYPGGGREPAAVTEALVLTADRVVVNSHQARAELLRKHGRRGTHVPHSHVLTLEEIDHLPPGRRIPPFTLGVLLADSSSDPTAEAVVEAMTQLARESNCFRARVDVGLVASDTEKRSGSLSALLSGLERRNQIDLMRHGRIGRAEVRNFATDVDIAMFPSWTGSNSGWIEACRDAGTAVIAPAGADMDTLRPGFGFRVFPTGVPNRSDLEFAIEGAQQVLVSGEIESVGADRRRHHRRLVASEYSRIFSAVRAGGTAETKPPRSENLEEVAA